MTEAKHHSHIHLAGTSMAEVENLSTGCGSQSRMGVASEDNASCPDILAPVDHLDRLRTEMVRVLPTRSTRERDAFAALGVGEQAWRFMNWQSRLVHPHPRQVNRAVGFDGLPAVRAKRDDIEALIAGISRGDDVNGYLSHDVKQGYCLHPPGKKDGPDFDLLLNEWGIHHLHLDHAPGKGGFRKRSDELLYAILGRGVAFVLGVAPHGAWTSRRLIEATIRSWPDQGLFVSLGVLPGRDWTEGEHKALRRAGMTTAALVDDKPWISGVTGSMSSALVSNRVVREAGRVLRCVYQATEHPGHVECQLMANAAAIVAPWPAEPVIRVRWVSGPDRYCFGFVEETSDATVII